MILFALLWYWHDIVDLKIVILIKVLDDEEIIKGYNEHKRVEYV